jgi:hypothetical protein
MCVSSANSDARRSEIDKFKDVHSTKDFGQELLIQSFKFQFDVVACEATGAFSAVVRTPDLWSGGTGCNSRSLHARIGQPSLSSLRSRLTGPSLGWGERSMRLQAWQYWLAASLAAGVAVHGWSTVADTCSLLPGSLWTMSAYTNLKLLNLYLALATLAVPKPLVEKFINIV